MKILIADDKAENRYLFEVLLKAYGYEVVSAANGVEALEMLRQDRVGLIISDIMMPVMDGFKLCRVCKQDERLKDIPFIFITAAYTSEKDEQFAMSLGADRFIRRPIESDDLIGIVKDVVAKQRAGHTPSLPAQEKEEASYLAEYAERVVSKLEQKVNDLEVEIAARKQAEQQLNQYTEEVEDLYNRAPCGYHSLDKDGVFVRINDTELSWLGYTREELVGKMNFADLITRDSLKAFQECFSHLKEHGSVLDIEFDMLRKDGTVLPVLMNASVVKDDNGDYLMCRATVYDITERKALQQELERQARTDSLTGISNRRYFMQRAEQELGRSRRFGHTLSMLMLDIDFFKAVNDNHGHAAGDMVLILLAKIACNAVRDVDVLGRIGGEEFAILLPETDTQMAAQVAERLRQEIETASVPIEQGPAIHFTISIGVATLRDDDAGIDALLKHADQALYEAKQTGRNRVCIANAGTHPMPAQATEGGACDE
ncbi:hypothetical protein FGKAn22_07800 [Ferrigenium kumadai]|uniref:diguanylate cyclase n=1 Tax=Ferrigenium kumadai TaxID=1682490 RepID=A0AAN1SY51_9PROT|nr:diguanylate cyclase [Ferrigenium kumadai]BBI99087.1 hypothetical protein FGKAn22_07800 [Ferrigenium kumadai]